MTTRRRRPTKFPTFSILIGLGLLLIGLTLGYVVGNYSKYSPQDCVNRLTDVGAPSTFTQYVCYGVRPDVR